VGGDPADLPARYHRAFNERNFDAWRELFHDDVVVVVDGIAFRGVDAAVGYGVVSLSQFPGLRIGSEQVVAESGGVVVVELTLLNGDPGSDDARPQGTTCEIWRVRDGRAVSVHSYYMPEAGETAAEVRVPSRAEAAVIAEEHAALRRVATLVARDVSQDELFAAVTREVGWLVAADATSLTRFEPDDTITMVAAWSARQAELPVGGNRPLDDVLRTVRDDGAPWRSGPAELPPTGSFVEEARELGLRVFVAVPIVVEGRVWGAAIASSAGDRPFAGDAETRLTAFVELVATAIANAQSRLRMRSYADEQAALRRVAVRVARGAPPDEVFTAVAVEVGKLLQVDYTVLSRYDADGMITVVGGWAREDPGRPLAVGLRLKPEGRNIHSLVFASGQPARIDDYGQADGAFADVARDWAYRSSVGVPVSVVGRLWGVLIVGSRVQPLPSGTEERLAAFTELVATAIANTEAQAALAASRARIVAAADATRRRVERDLHDGAQQRLVSLALRVRGGVTGTVPPEVRALVDELATEITEIVEELRELARGLHPAVLAEGGLRPALRMLARRSAVPVELDCSVDWRLPEPIELAAYYVVAEALTNAVKHAGASSAVVTVDSGEGLLRVRVSDDGSGGADPASGSGLSGLADRVEALGGRLSLHSPPGEGTSVQITLPLAVPTGVWEAGTPPSEPGRVGMGPVAEIRAPSE
jgi:signal transduction histidine kinase/ketosteroid isomerase-like protein